MKIYFSLILVLAVSCKSSSQIQQYNYPTTIAKPVVENFKHLTLTDEYKYLQNTNDTLVQAWFLKQTAFTDSIFRTYKQIEAIEKQFRENSKAKLEGSKYLRQDTKGGLFYCKYREQDPVSLLFYKAHPNADEIILFKPKDYKPESGLEYYIDYIKPSWDGNYVVLSLRHSNTYTSEVVVLDVKTKTLTNDYVSNCRGKAFGGVQWLPDSSGFTYYYFPVVEKGKENYLANGSTLYHPLHSGNKKGTHVFGTKGSFQVDPSYYPLVGINSANDKYVFGYIMDNSHYYKTYYAPIEVIKSGNPNWKLLHEPKDLIYASWGIFYKNHYYYMSAKNAPNFQINRCHIDSLDIPKPMTIVEQKEDEVLSDFEFVKEGMYYSSTKNGVEAKLYFKDQHSTKLVALPFSVGSIRFIDSHGEGDHIIIECSGWSNDKTRLLINKDSVVKQLILSAPPIRPKFDNLVSEQILVKGHDGVEIPVSLIYDKVKGKTNRPALIESYGAYGHNSDPYYSTMLSTWISLGGIRVVAHIRGGGEKGKAWYDAGKKATKNNSWKDLISVTQYVIDKGYTSEDKTVLYSASAGAVSQAMAAIVKPDLFAVFLANVPLLNPLKLKEGSHVELSYTEFGDVDLAEEAPYLLKLDPYYNLEPNTNFPPTLLFASGKDDVLDIWETGKFIAKLQNSENSRAPALLKVMPDWGHGSYSKRTDAEMFAFALNNIKSSGAEH